MKPLVVGWASALAVAALAAIGTSGARAAGADPDWAVCSGDDDAKAVTACTQILQRRHLSAADRAEALVDRCVSYDNLKNYDSATTDCNTAIKLKPDYATAFSNRGNAYDDKGDYDRAIADYDQAIKLKPDYAAAFFNRGVAYDDKGHYDRAIADYDQAIGLDQTKSGYYFGRGLAYLHKGNRLHAASDYATAQTLSPDKQDRWNQGRRRKAKEALEALLAASSPDPQSPLTASHPQASLRRVALLVANAKYINIRSLDSPPRDIAAVEAALVKLGFDVTVKLDLDQRGLKEAFRDFESNIRANPPDWALVYFSGHGTETPNGPFMLPTDVLVPKDMELTSEANIEEDAVGVKNVVLRLQAAKQLHLVIYDACRDNPVVSAFNRMLERQKGASDAANRSTGVGFGHDVVFYATSSGTYSWDGSPGDVSPFAKSFVSELSVSGLDLEQLFERVKEDVRKETSPHLAVPQIPDERGFPVADKFYFNPPTRTAQ